MIITETYEIKESALNFLSQEEIGIEIYSKKDLTFRHTLKSFEVGSFSHHEFTYCKAQNMMKTAKNFKRDHGLNWKFATKRKGEIIEFKRIQ